MSQVIEIELNEGKTYKLGFPTRKDIKYAEKQGLDISNAGKAVSFYDTLYYTAFLANHPSMTEYEAQKIIEKYVDEGGDLGEIQKFLIDQYSNFIQSPEKSTITKKAKIINI